MKRQAKKLVSYVNKKNRKIWKRFRKGNDVAVTTIYVTYYPILSSYGRQFTKADIVKDCIQELFNYLIENRKKLGKTDNIEAYLKASLRRRLICIANRKEIQQIEIDDTLHISCASINTEICPEVWERLHDAFCSLPQKQFQVIRLKYFEHLQYKEIAHLMSTTKQYAKTLHHRGLQRLKQDLKGLKIISQPDAGFES